MKIYIILLIIATIICLGAYFYFNREPLEEKPSLKERMKKISLEEFKKDFPKVDRTMFISIKNDLRHSPDEITEEYLREILE